MSGILSSEKRTSYRILSEEFPEKLICDYFWRYNSFLPEELETKLKNFNSIDTVSDDKTLKNSRNKLNNARRYFQHEGKVYSIYESIFFRPNQNGGLSNKYAVFLMSNEEFAGAIINNGEITMKKAFNHSSQDGNSKKSSRRGTEQLLSDVSTLLKSWEDELKYVQVVYTHCTSEHGKFLREEINKLNNSWYKAYFQKVPFNVDGASREELTRVWDKLFSVVEHGSTQSFIKALETGQMQTVVDDTEDSEQSSTIESTKQQRRDEKQRWPGLNPQKKIELNEALMSNQYEKLQDLVENNQEIIDYLSTTHEKLGGQTYMHYATKENLIEAVEFLLNVGCDPSLADDTGKVPYDYAKTIEMKQTFVDFRNENSEGRQWTKSHVPEEVEVSSPPSSSKPNKKNADKPKPKGASGKSKKNQKYVDMMDDDFDYDDYAYEEDFELETQAPPKKTQQVNNFEAEKDQELDESDTESKLKTHSLLDEEWRPTEFQYTRSFWTAAPLNTVGTAKVECKQLRKFLDKRLQASVKTYFSDHDVLYSGYSAILGGFNTLHNRAFKPYAVILINDEYFVGTAFDNGKACRRKTLYRNSANWTKIRDFTKGNLTQNRFIDEKLSNCIQNVMNYWTAEVEIKVLYSCPPEFEWFLKEHILEFRRYAKFECLPFAVKNYTYPEINRIWRKMTTLSEHGQLNTFDKAVEEKDYETLDKMLDDPTEVVLPFHKDKIWEELTADQRKEIHKAILKNDYEALNNVAADHYWYIDYLKKPHAKFGGETFLKFAKRENLDEVVKYLLKKGCNT